MFFPKMGLTREELEAILTPRLFQQDKDSHDGKEEFEKIKYLRRNLHLFTDEILNEEFSKIVFHSREEISLKIELRILLWDEARNKGEITTKDYITYILALGSLMQQMRMKLLATFDPDYDEFPYMEMDLKKFTFTIK